MKQHLLTVNPLERNDNIKKRNRESPVQKICRIMVTTKNDKMTML